MSMSSRMSTFSIGTDEGRLSEAQARASRSIKPVVMIFDSKHPHSRQNTTRTSRMPSIQSSQQTFAFVNFSGPGKADEESRRLVKTHVMQNVLRRKPVEYYKELLRSTGTSPRAPPSSLLTFPIQTEPYMLKLVHDYATAMLPTKTKVIDSPWFPLVMTDAALFHALLCTSALFGFCDMIVQRKHMAESIRLINERLPGVGATSDATITAILFMAKAEYFQGNREAWKVHMNGMKKIVELRGGIDKLPRAIQQKIYGTDLLCCMEFGAVPHFPTTHPPKPLSPPAQYNLPPAVAALAKEYTFDLEVVALLSEIPTHTTPSPTKLDTTSVLYGLLILYSRRQYRHPLPSSIIPAETFHSQVQQSESEIVQELLLLGALLFLSLPHKRPLPPLRPVDYGYLLSRLNPLTSALFGDHPLMQHLNFLLWLSFLGDVFSSTSISFSTCPPEFSPFRLQLRAVSAMLKIATWEDMNIALGEMWAIEPRFETPYRRLWEEAVIGHK